MCSFHDVFLQDLDALGKGGGGGGPFTIMGGGVRVLFPLKALPARHVGGGRRVWGGGPGVGGPS